MVNKHCKNTFIPCSVIYEELWKIFGYAYKCSMIHPKMYKPCGTALYENHHYIVCSNSYYHRYQKFLLLNLKAMKYF